MNNRSDNRTPEQMVDYLLRREFSECPEPEHLRSEVQRFSQTFADSDGLVLDDVQTKVAWIYWRVN